MRKTIRTHLLQKRAILLHFHHGLGSVQPVNATEIGRVPLLHQVYLLSRFVKLLVGEGQVEGLHIRIELAFHKRELKQTRPGDKAPFYHAHHTRPRHNRKVGNVPRVLEVVRRRYGHDLLIAPSRQLPVLRNIDVANRLRLVPVRKNEVVQMRVVRIHLHLQKENAGYRLQRHNLERVVHRSPAARVVC